MDNTLQSEVRELTTKSQQLIVMIQGERVALGPFSRELIPIFRRWNNDLLVTRTCARQYPTTLEEETDAYDRVVRDKNFVLFTLYEQSSLRPIGYAYLSDVDYRNRTAEYGIVIGEADCRGKEYGTETTRLILDFGFTVLGLHNILLKVYEFNQAGIRAYEKAGFRHIGRRHQARVIGGRQWDVLFMECLSSDFASPLLAHSLMLDVS
jgi:RimJ/RimL family protein N-acetyltransferase